MPIYEYACPHCRVIFSFLSKRVTPSHTPACPKCGGKKLSRQISRFAPVRGGRDRSAQDNTAAEEGPDPLANFDESSMAGVMRELEQDMDRIDENNPRHMGYLIRKIKNAMPDKAFPKELDIAIKRLEAGEDPEKIEEDMGDILSQVLGGAEESGSPGGGYARDPGLYDM